MKKGLISLALVMTITVIMAMAAANSQAATVIYQKVEEGEERFIRVPCRELPKAAEDVAAVIFYGSEISTKELMLVIEDLVSQGFTLIQLISVEADKEGRIGVFLWPNMQLSDIQK